MNIKEDLLKLQDKKYQEFHSRLCPGVNNIIGIRTPTLRNYAKKIAKENWKEFLDNPSDEYYEEILLQGMLIGIAKMEIEKRFYYLKQFIPKINN